MVIGPSDALLIIDPQNDFCEGGALAVEGGAGIMPLIVRLAERFDRVVVTQDWHTPDQISFAFNHPGAQPPSGSPRRRVDQGRGGVGPMRPRG